MNILILSAGTRNKIIHYFKHTLDGKGNVIATDMQNIAPAIYDADKFYLVPCVTDPGYVDCILEICRKEKINAVLSLIDPELSLLAENEDRFEELGVRVIGSPYEQCERAYNKMKMFSWLKEHGYRCAVSYDDKDEFYRDLDAGLISFPVFVKPICGSASVAITKAENRDVIELLWKYMDGLLIQEYLNGQEIGADVYIDMISHEVVSIFTKKKLLMRAGETDKAVSFKDEKLFELIERFCNDCGWVGQIDIDIFDVDGEYYISEVNPRFGGGYPHAYECGVDHMKLIENNVNGIINEKDIGTYDEGIYMMKYNEMKVLKI